MSEFIDPLEVGEELSYPELLNQAGRMLGGIDPAGNRTDQALRSAVFSDEAERFGVIRPQYHGIFDSMADSAKATTLQTAAGFAKSFGADQYAQHLERIVQDHPEWQQSEQQGLAGWLAYNGVSGLVTTAPTILAGLAMPASAPLWAIRALQGTVTGAQLFGDNFEKALELSNGKMSPYAALGIATLNTTVQAGIEMSLGPQRWLTDSLRRAMTRQLTKDAVEKIGIMATSKLMPRVGKMLVAGFEEGNEELLQLGSDDIASKFLSKGASEMSKAGDYIQNFLAGAWGGIVLGAPANIVEHVVKNRVAKDINALAKAPTPEQQAAIADRYLPGAVRADPMLLDEARRQFMAQEDAAFATLEGQIEDPAMKPVVPVMHNIAYQMSAMDGGRARPSQYIETLKTVFLDESKLDPGDLEQMRKEMAATSDETQRFNVMRRYFPKFDLAVQSVQKAREIARLTEMRDMLGRSNRDKAPLPQMDKQTSGQFIDMLSALAQKAMGETEAGSATIDRSTLFGWLDSGELNTESLRHIILSGGIDGIKIGSKTYRMKLNSDLSLSVVESVAAAEDRAADPTPILTMLKKGDADGLRASNQDIEITKLKIAITEVARQREMLDLLDAMDGVNTTEERLQKLADLRHASAKIDGLNAQIAQMRAEQEAGKATEAPEVQKERARQITSFEQMAKELEQFRKPVALLPERATQARQMPDLDRMTYMELQEAARQAGMKDWEGFSQPELKAKLLTRYTAINQIGDGFTPEQLDAMDEITLRQVAAISGMEPEDLTPAQIKVRLLSAFPRQSTPLMERGEKRASRLTDDQRKAWDITGTYLRDSRLAVFYADADMETIIHEWFHHLSTSGLLPEGMSKHLMRRWGVNAKGQTIADIRRQYEKAGQPPPSEEELMNGIRWTNTSEENAVREFLAYIRDARIDDPQTKAIFDAVRDTFSRMYYRVSDEYTKEGVLASMAGRSAATAGDTSRAEAMETEGKDRTAIWNETGWYRGVDGNWRFEVDDGDLKFSPGFAATMKNILTAGRGSMRIGDYVTARKVFKAYPWLRDTKFQIEGDATEGASYDPSTDTITLPKNIRSNDPKRGIEKTVAHEIQHAIQEREGFARGGSIVGAGAMRADVSSRLNRLRQIDDRVDSWLKEQDRILNESSDDEVDAMLKAHQKTAPQSLIRFWDEARQMSGTDETIYRRLAGEAEARLVARRLDMNAEQRKAEPPWVTMEKMLREEGLLKEGQKPEDVLIVRRGGGTSGQLLERRITPEQDAAYAALAAKAEAGDKQAEAEAQRMVDEAAKAAGYYGGQPDSVRQAWQERSRQLDVAIDIAKSNIERSEAAIPRHDPSTTIGKIARKSLERNREQLRSLTAERDAGQPVSPLYHGSSHEWTVYRRKAGGRSIWTSDNAEVAGTYGDRTTPLYMMMNRPMVFDAQGASYRDLMFEGKRLDADDLAQIAEERGHDGLIIRNFYDSNTDDGGSVIADHYTTFTPEHIKSADPFTYEEQADGTKKLVDLSRRFNSEEDSILLERRPVGVAAEFVFGTDAPLWNEYPGFMQASAEAKSEVTRRAAEAIQPILKSEFGEDMLTHSFGEGGWMKGVSPNVVTSFKTKDVAIRAADAIGAAWQQDGMMVANADEAGTDSMMVFGKVDVSDLTMEERRAVYPLIEEILFPAMQAANPDAVIGFTQINRGVDTPEQMMIAMPFSSKEQTSALLESVWSKIEASVKEKLNIDLDRATESGTVVFRSKGSDYTWKEGNADDRTKSSTENGVRSFAGRIQDATRTVLDQAKREQLFEREERAQAGTQAGTQARETIGFNPEADAAMGQLLKPVAGETLGAIMGDGLYGDLRYRSTFESRVPSPGEVEQAAQAAAQAGEGGVLMDRRSPADRQNRNGQPLLERRNPLYSKDQAQERTRAEVNRQLHAVFYNADDKEMTHQKASDFVKEFIRTRSGRTITSLTEATDDELKAATEDAASKFGRGKAYFSDRLVQQFFGTHMTAEEYKAYNPEAFAWMTDRLMDEIGIPAMGTRIANMGAEASALADVQDKLHYMRPVRPNVASGNLLVTETKNALKRLLQAGIKYTHGLYDMCKALDDSNEGVMKSSASFTKLVWARFRDANHAIARKYLPVEQEYADRVKNGDFFKNAFEVFTLSNGEKYSYNEMLVIYSLANGQRVSSGTLETTDKSGKKKLKQEYRDLAAWLYGNIGTDDASVSKGIATANAIVDRINGDATLKRQALAEIGWQNDIGLKFFETAAKVYKDWSGRDARPLKGMYTPIVRLSSDIKEGDLEGIWESMDGREFEFLNLDALKEFHRRSGGRGGEIKLDYRGNFLRHIEAMSNYTEKRALVEETLTMLGVDGRGNGRLRDALRRRFGSDDIVLSGLEKAIRREMKPSGLHSDDNMGGSILGKIQRNFYASVFPWNVFTVPTQLTSLSNGWAEAGLSPTVVGQSMKYLGNIAAHVTKNMSRFKSGQVSHILSGLDMYEEAKRLVPSLMRRFPIAEADTYRRNQSFLSRHLKGYDKMIEEGQLFMELGDMGAVLPTWKALFEENKNRMAIEHKDWNASRIEQEAANAAYDAVVQSQNPSTQTEKSLWQTGSPMAKAMIPFSGQTFVLLHNLINDVALPLHNAIQEKGLARGVKDVVLRKQFLAKYAGRFVIPAILMGMIARRRPPEDWQEVAKDIAVYPFTTVPVIGNMIWASMFLGWKDGGPVSFYETLAKDATDLIKNAAALQWDQKDTEKLTRTAGLAVGFPQAIIRILNTTIDNAVHENKNWDGESLKKALGFKTKG